MNQLRSLVSAILDKADMFLTTEPARLIGYGAAIVVFLTVQIVGHFKPGVLPQVSFDDAVGMAFAAITTLVILVESIRRFVYAPMTYIEDLSDESAAAHEAAHIEEAIRQHFAQRAALEAESRAVAAEAQASQPVFVPDPGKAN